ncbi:MAG TPA: DUF5671 domain-containing protein [Candidatus Nanoarchaeia archaeon]|nr:DUF5671 domain-containing protein [Candidatus Nanoarchaeia archaeon]
MDQSTAVAAPKSNAAKFVFLYLLHLVALGFMTVSFGNVIFQIINKYIPDITAPFAENKFAISALLVSIPIFYVVSYLIQKSLFSGELKKESAIRRWLTYLILFVSFLIFFGWLIYFVNSYLNGEVTFRFVLKTITVLIIAGAVFGFYFYDIRRPVVENVKDKLLKIFFIVSLIIVIAAFTASFFTVESPSLARDRKLDDQITNNFNNIYQCVDMHYNQTQKLPDGFATMLSECPYLTADNIKDAQTGQNFTYDITSTTTYEICANFRTSNIGAANNPQGIYPVAPGYNGSAHAAGYQCLKGQVFPTVKTLY